VNDVLSLILQVLPLALGAAISPTFLAMQMVILTGDEPRALRRAWALAAGSMSMLLVLSFGGLSLLSSLPDGGTGKPSYPQAAILTIAGTALLVLAAAVWRRPTSHRQSRLMGRIVDARPSVLFGIGAARLAVNATTLALYIPALHTITHSTVDIVVKALVFLMLFAITEIAVVGPVLVVTLMGERAKPVLSRIHLAIQKRSRVLTVAVCLVFGLVLLVLGVRTFLQVM
jgi:hypothetical protein